MAVAGDPRALRNNGRHKFSLMSLGCLEDFSLKPPFSNNLKFVPLSLV